MGTHRVSHPLLHIALLLLFTLLLSLYTTLCSFCAVRELDKAGNGTVVHSYIIDDIPNQFPGDYPSAAMIMRPTSEYPLVDDKVWLTMIPPGQGFIRLGPKGRPFGVSLYLQLHCVNLLRFAYTIARDGLVTDREKLLSNYQLSNHCFQTLRQGIICKGDLTLIPSDGPGRFNQTQTYRAHRCRDWTKVRESVAKNVEEWSDVPLVMDPDFTSSTFESW